MGVGVRVKINFVLNTSPNYTEVQSNIFSLIMEKLGRDEYTVGKYREGSLNFSLFIRDRADVVMSHGVADKNYFWVKDEQGLRYADRLKAVLVPGRWLKDRIVRSRKLQLGSDRVFSVGWPRLDMLRQLAAARGGDRVKGGILWAPTHDKVKRGAENKSTSSYPDFEAWLPALREKYPVEVSLHPRNRKDKKPTIEKLVDADYVISDFGTMVYEAWALGKPVIFPRWILGNRIQEYLPHSAEAYIFEKRIGYHADSPGEMMEILDSGPVLTSDVEEFMDSYLDNYRSGNASERIATVLREMAGAA
jgi:hypothetical protein